MSIILSGDFMFKDNKKVVIVGVGMVSMSFAYSMLNQNICDELVLIDIDKERAAGEAADLSHGLPFAPSSMKIHSGEYGECRDADVVAICAGAPQKPGETRRDLLKKNYNVFRTIVNKVVSSGFSGVFLVASNPVDVMTRLVYSLSGFPSGRVLGSGTALDSARLRHMMSDYFNINPRNVHAYVIGEHGDSEFVAWSNAFLSVKPIAQLAQNNPQLMEDMHRIAVDVRDSAYEIIRAKKATYYGIGMGLQGSQERYCLMKTRCLPFRHILRESIIKRGFISECLPLLTPTASGRLWRFPYPGRSLKNSTPRHRL